MWGFGLGTRGCPVHGPKVWRGVSSPPVQGPKPLTAPRMPLCGTDPLRDQ